MTRRGFLLSGAFAAIALALGACSAASTPTADAGSAQEEGPSRPPATAAASPSSTAAEVVAPTETRSVRADQYATDPSTVDLTAGRPTLVKFFAFW